MRKLALLAVLFLLAVWVLEWAVTGGVAPVVFAAPKSTRPMVTQTVSALDPNTSKYTVEFSIPVDANTDLTDASVLLHREVYQGDTSHGECRCYYQRSSGVQNCDTWGDFPVTASAKYTKHLAVVTCTFTGSPSGLYSSELWVIGTQDWRFPGIYGELGHCTTCPTDP